MTLADIENMSAAELKANRSEIEAAIKDAPDLVPRHMKTLIDAKTRDEKLAEQGKTITALQDSLDASHGREKEECKKAVKLNGEVDSLLSERASLLKEVGDLKAAHTKQLDMKVKLHRERVEVLEAHLGDANAARDKAAALARRRRTVIADITKLTAPLLVEE